MWGAGEGSVGRGGLGGGEGRGCGRIDVGRGESSEGLGGTTKDGEYRRPGGREELKEGVGGREGGRLKKECVSEEEKKRKVLVSKAISPQNVV